MAIDRQWIVETARTSDPGFYQDWEDEDIFLAAVEQFPQLREHFAPTTEGEQYYEAYGKGREGFGEGGMGVFDKTGLSIGQRLTRWGETTGQRLDVASDIVAAEMGWGSLQDAEAKRQFYQATNAALIEANPRYHADLLWQEDQPGWTNLDTGVRSFIEAAPSLGISIASTLGAAAAVAATPATAGGSVALYSAAALAMTPMASIEFSGQLDGMISTLVDEHGLSIEEATDLAMPGAMAYTAIATGLEYLGAKHFLRIAGLTNKYKPTMTSAIMDKMVKAGTGKNALIKGVTKAGAGSIAMFSQGMAEATTEGLQSLTGMVIERGVELGISDNPATVLERYQQAFEESWLSPQMKEEAFAGATTGILGVGGFIHSDVRADRNALERMVKMQEDGVLNKILAKDETTWDQELEAYENENPEEVAEMKPILDEIDERIRAGTVELTDEEKALKYGGGYYSFLRRQAGLQKKAEKKPVSTTEDVSFSGIPAEPASVSPISETDDDFSVFLKSILDPRTNQPILKERIGAKTDGLSKKIQKALGIKDLGKRILSVVEDDKSLVDAIVEDDNSEFLLSLVGDAFNERLPKGSKLLNVSDVIKKLKEPYKLIESQGQASIRGGEAEHVIVFDEEYEKRSREGSQSPEEQRAADERIDEEQPPQAQTGPQTGPESGPSIDEFDESTEVRDPLTDKLLNLKPKEQQTPDVGSAVGKKALASIQRRPSNKHKIQAIKALTPKLTHEVAEVLGIEVPLTPTGKKQSGKSTIKGIKTAIYEKVKGEDAPNVQQDTGTLERQLNRLLKNREMILKNKKETGVGDTQYVDKAIAKIQAQIGQQPSVPDTPTKEPKKMAMILDGKYKGQSGTFVQDGNTYRIQLPNRIQPVYVPAHQVKEIDDTKEQSLNEKLKKHSLKSRTQQFKSRLKEYNERTAELVASISKTLDEIKSGTTGDDYIGEAFQYSVSWDKKRKKYKFVENFDGLGAMQDGMSKKDIAKEDEAHRKEISEGKHTKYLTKKEYIAQELKRREKSKPTLEYYTRFTEGDVQEDIKNIDYYKHRMHLLRKRKKGDFDEIIRKEGEELLERTGIESIDHGNVYKLGTGELRSIKGSQGAIEGWGWIDPKKVKSGDFDTYKPDAYILIDPLGKSDEVYIRYSFTGKESRRQGANTELINEIRKTYPNKKIVRGMIDNPAILESSRKIPGATLYDGSPIPSFKTKDGFDYAAFEEWQDTKSQDILLPALATKEPSAPVKKGLMKRMTEKIASVISPNAKKAGYLPKEQVKTKIATQFIGQGSKGSSTDRYAKMYGEEGAANTGNYTSDDVIFIASNGKRPGAFKPVVNGVLQGAYKNIDKAMEAGATIVMDTGAFLDSSKGWYNTGEKALAEYLSNHGYERQGKESGQWKPIKRKAKAKAKAKESISLQKPPAEPTDPFTLTEEEENDIITGKRTMKEVYASKGVQVEGPAIQKSKKAPALPPSKKAAPEVSPEEDVIYDVKVDMMENPNIKSKDTRTGKEDNQDVWVVDSLGEAEAQLKSIKEGKGGGVNFADEITKEGDHYVIKHKYGDDKHIYVRGENPIPKGLKYDSKGRSKGKPYTTQQQLAREPAAPPEKAPTTPEEQLKKAAEEKLRLESKPFVQQIIKAITEPMSAHEIAKAIGFPTDKIYYHLKKLLKANLIYHADSNFIKGIEQKKFLPVGVDFKPSLEKESEKIQIKKEKTAENAGFENWWDVTTALELENTAEMFNQLDPSQILEAARELGLSPKFDGGKIKGLTTSMTQEEFQALADKAANRTEEDAEINRIKQNMRKRDKNDGDESVDYQKEGQSSMPLMDSDPVVAEKIYKRLKKHFPFIDQVTFTEMIDEHGVKIMGFAMDRMVGWATSGGTLDTLPHEYAHIYVKMLREDSIIKKGIELWGSEENLVQAIGEYYANRMKSPYNYKRIKNWISHWIKKLKKRFGNLDLKEKEEVKNFIAEEFFKGRFLADEVIIGGNFFETQLSKDDANNVDLSDDDVGGEDGAHGEEKSKSLKEMPTSVHIMMMYSKILGVYLEKSKHYPELIDMAKRHENIESYTEELFEWAKKISPYVRDINKLTPRQRRLIANDFVKAKRRIPGWVKGDNSRQGDDRRIYQEYVLNTNEGISTRGADDKINNKKFPENYTMNFIEADQLEGQHSQRLIRLPIKQIMKRFRIEKENEPDTYFYKSASKELKMSDLKNIQDSHKDAYAQEIWKSVERIKAKAMEQIALYEQNELLGTDPQTVKLWVQQELINLGTEGLTGHSLVSVVGTKLGDNSAVVSTVAREHPLSMTRAKFESILDDALSNNLIRQEHHDIMMEESGVNKLRESEAKLLAEGKELDPITKMGWGKYILSKIAETENTDLTMSQVIDGLEGEIAKLVYWNTPMSQSLAQLRFWQNVRTPDYFMYEKSATDSMIRLSINMAEGPTPVGMEKILGRKGRLMIVDSENTWIRNDKLPGDRIQYKKVDGSTFTGSGIMKAMSNALGHGNALDQLKTFIRQRDVVGGQNEAHSVDYIGMKHMMFTAYDGMIIEDNNGNMIAQLVTRDNLSFWEDAAGNEFDMIASDNEAKMTFGKYASIEQKTKAFGEGEYVDGYNTIHDINEDSIAVTQIADRSKFSASHPIQLGEMLLAAGSTQKEVDKLLSTIQGRYVDVVNHYTDTIKEFYSDPSKLKAFVDKAKEDGEIPTELEDYIDLIDESGLGMFHDVIITHLLPVINSRIIRNGIYKARSWERNSTNLYLKHATNLGIEEMDTERNEKGVFVSAGNDMATQYVEREMAKFMGVGLNNRGRIDNNQIVKVWSNTDRKMIEKKWGDIGYSKQIQLMNDFLEESPQHVLIHRNPIAKITGPVTRRLHKIVVQTDNKGKVTATHGETFMMTQDDVDNVLDGDWDGDKGQVEFITADHADIMLGWQNSELFNEWDKTVHIDMFGPKADVDPNLAGTTVLSRRNVFGEIKRNSNSDGAVGVMTNARSVMSQLFHKKVEARPYVKNEKGESVTADYVIRVTDPSAKTVMNYRPLDLTMLNKDGGDLINKIYENGDRIVSPDPVKGLLYLPVQRNEDGTISEEEGVLYLETTKGHEFSILFQMAVDGTKYHAWSNIVANSGLDNFNFMISKMFEAVNDNGSERALSKADIRTAGGIYSNQNMSKHRGGRTPTGLQADYPISIAQSQSLFRRMMDKVLPDSKLKKANVKGTLSDAEYSDRFNAEHESSWKNAWTTKSFGYEGHGKIDLKMENNLTPTEILLMNVGDKVKSSPLYNIFHNRAIKKTVHVMALQNMQENRIIQSLHDTFSDRDKLFDYNAARNLLTGKIEISTLKGSKLGTLLATNREGKTETSLIDLWRILKDETHNMDAVRSDMNEAFIEFADYFIPMYDKMNIESQKLFTYMSLVGAGHDIYALKFLPLRIQDNSIVKVYLKEYGKALREGHLSQDELIRRAKINQENKIYTKLHTRKEALLKGEETDTLKPEYLRKEAGRPGGYKAWLQNVYNIMDPKDKKEKPCG